MQRGNRQEGVSREACLPEDREAHVGFFRVRRVGRLHVREDRGGRRIEPPDGLGGVQGARRELPNSQHSFQQIETSGRGFSDQNRRANVRGQEVKVSGKSYSPAIF